MKRLKIRGYLLMGTSILVLLGMLVNNNHLWFGIDIFVILICGITGYWLERQK
ncbi:MAG: hypothetical protein JW827_12080 [Spirochaetes bacterium]|nr:hypothetical protein [Spirochaetota bacterium]